MNDTAANWMTQCREDGLPALGERIAKSLPADAPFCLWLKGSLGAGKTALAGHILRALGLPRTLPVTSPTYTYMNEYRIGASWYAHLDLYRAGSNFDLEDLGLVDARDYRGSLVEWPEQIPVSPPLTPTHVLDIAFSEDGQSRIYCFASHQLRPT